MSDAVKSLSVKIGPEDKRCRYWAKIIRAGSALPAPSSVNGANDVPGNYARNGDEELFAGDIMIDGEELNHRKARGWSYRVIWMDPETGERRRIFPNSDVKAELKTNGLPAALLAGSGDVAACIRIAHAIRVGIDFSIPE